MWLRFKTLKNHPLVYRMWHC